MKNRQAAVAPTSGRYSKSEKPTGGRCYSVLSIFFENISNVVLLLIALLLTSPLQSQKLNISVDQIHELKDLSIDNHIKCLSKDSNGNIWVGADNGLYRYNGEQLDKIDIDFIKDLLLTREGELLVLADEGLYSIQTSPFDWHVQQLVPGGNPISDSTLLFPKKIYQDVEGAIWIAENQYLIRYHNKALKRFLLTRQNVGNYLRHSFTFAEDGFGTLWTMSFDGSLYRFDRMAEQFVNVQLPIQLNEASELSSDGAHKLFVGTYNGIFEISIGEKATLQNMRKVSSINKVSAITVLDNYAMVASFENGLFRIDSDNYEGQQISSFENLDILDIVRDGKQIWIASSESIFVINEGPFYTFPQTLNQFVPTIQQAKDNSFIVNLGKQIFQITKTPQGTIFEELLRTDNPYFTNDALLDRQSLWLANAQGVLLYDLNSKKLSSVDGIPTAPWLGDIYQSSEGSIWVSNQEEGDLIQINQKLQIRTFPEYNKVRFVSEDKNRIYFAGSEAMFAIRDEEGSFQTISLNFPSSKPNFNDIAFFKDSIFLASDQGIYSISKSELFETNIQPKHVLSGQIESIAIDQTGTIWFATTSGLSRLENGELVTFNRSQGLPSKYIVKRGLLMDYQNQLWICTSKGLATLSNSELKAYKTPKAAIVSCSENNENLPVTDFNLGTFLYNSTISLKLLALAYPSNSLQYEVSLVADDQILSKQTSNGLLSFFGLNTGTYQLEIKAKQTGAAWSDPVFYNFEIKRKWYQSGWFYLLLILAASGLAYFLVHLYNKNLRQTNEKLEKLVKARTASLEAQKNQLVQTQEQIVAQQKELINQNEVLSETQKALTNSEIQFLELKRTQMRRELELKTKQLTTHALSILQKNQYLSEISKKLYELSKSENNKELSKSARQISQQIQNSLKQDDRWEEFRLYFEQVHDDFYAKLKTSFPKLTANDLKQCALVKLNLSLEESATLLGVSAESVRISRYRIQKKMDLNSQAAFHEYLVKL